MAETKTLSKYDKICTNFDKLKSNHNLPQQVILKFEHILKKLIPQLYSFTDGSTIPLIISRCLNTFIKFLTTKNNEEGLVIFNKYLFTSYKNLYENRCLILTTQQPINGKEVLTTETITSDNDYDICALMIFVLTLRSSTSLSMFEQQKEQPASEEKNSKIKILKNEFTMIDEFIKKLSIRINPTTNSPITSPPPSPRTPQTDSSPIFSPNFLRDHGSGNHSSRKNSPREKFNPIIENLKTEITATLIEVNSILSGQNLNFEQ